MEKTHGTVLWLCTFADIIFYFYISSLFRNYYFHITWVVTLRICQNKYCCMTSASVLPIPPSWKSTMSTSGTRWNNPKSNMISTFHCPFSFKSSPKGTTTKLLPTMKILTNSTRKWGERIFTRIFMSSPIPPTTGSFLPMLPPSIATGPSSNSCKTNKGESSRERKLLKINKTNQQKASMSRFYGVLNQAYPNIKYWTQCLKSKK